MSERSFYSITEVPVPEPNLFLLHRANRPFVERRNDKPYFLTLQAALSRRALIIFFVLLLLFSCYVGVFGVHLGVGAFVFGMPVLMVIAYVAGVRPTSPTADKVELAGWIIPGQVIHSEQIRVQGPSFQEERLGIRFQYASPDGEMTEAYVEGESHNATDTMAPAPGTPVRVWAGDDGKVYLL